MAASIYIYDGVEEYLRLYPKKTPLHSESPISAMFMYKDSGVWLVTKIENRVGPISPKHSLNVITNGMAGVEKVNNEYLTKITKVIYDYKLGQIQFKNDKDVCMFKVDRFVGIPIEKGKLMELFKGTELEVNTRYLFFDSTRQRINLILTPASSLVETEELSNPSPVFSA